MNDPSWTDVATAVGAILTAALAAGALYMAWRAWETAKSALTASEESARAAKEANEQARRDSIEQTRPYVFAEVLPGLAGVSTFDLRITNSGRSAANNLTLSYDSWPDASDDITSAVRGLLSTPRTLPPGCSLRALWRIRPGPGESLDNGLDEMGMGSSGALTTNYTSSDPSQPNYGDTFSVMIDDSGIWPVGEGGSDAPGLKGDTRKFYRLGQTLVRRVSELSR